MLPRAKTSRLLLCGAALILSTTALTAGLRLLAEPYQPQAPDYRWEGPAGARVTVTAFSDFMCGGCRAAVEPLKQLKTIFAGKIRVGFKHTFWDFHPNAKSAAVAAECAGREGKFWAYHDLLFSKQADWAGLEKPQAAYERLAKEAGADAARFSACLADPSARAAVEADLKEAKEHWVNATPTFFINGKRFVGARQLRTGGLNLIERSLKP